MLPAVDGQRGSRDKISLIGGQEGHATGDVGRMPQPPDRNARNDLLQHFAGNRAHHLGVDIARSDGIHRNAMPCPLLRQGLGKPMDAGLGGGIVHLAILPGLAVDAADIDDTAELACAHAVEGQLAQVEAGAEIGVDHRVPHLACQPRQRGIAGDAGVVHQNLDRSRVGGDPLDRLLARLEAAGIEFHHTDAGLLVEILRRLVVGGIARDDDAPLLLQGGADRGADASRSAGHQCDACHRSLPFSVPRTWRRPSRRRCTASPAPSSHRACPSRAAA